MVIFMDENLIVRLEREKVVSATFRKLGTAKKDKVYKAALNAFGEDVFDRVVLDDIARLAGVSKGSLIQYFGFKKNLLSFLAEMVVCSYENYFDDYFSSETAVRTKDRIERFFLKHLDFRKNFSGEFGFILLMLYENSGALSNRFIMTIFDIQHRYIQKIIERGVQTNQLRRDVRSRYLVSVLHSIFISLLREYFLDRSAIRKSDFEIHLGRSLNLVFNGVK
ncbi:MAG TPA: TetR/AcrR family transcriptional regulator [candidate division Zixibacteria bacterium]|nr:TetR/AcrR family transcriptional regulator [candidate division Zixibacteria bacterium]